VDIIEKRRGGGTYGRTALGGEAGGEGFTAYDEGDLVDEGLGLS
jgi:hypothetical protein